MAQNEKRKSKRTNGLNDLAHLKKRIRKTAHEVQGRREEIEKIFMGIEKQEKSLQRLANCVKQR